MNSFHKLQNEILNINRMFALFLKNYINQHKNSNDKKIQFIIEEFEATIVTLNYHEKLIAFNELKSLENFNTFFNSVGIVTKCMSSANKILTENDHFHSESMTT